jgi:hypothetical protein
LALQQVQQIWLLLLTCAGDTAAEWLPRLARLPDFFGFVDASLRFEAAGVTVPDTFYEPLFYQAWLVSLQDGCSAGFLPELTYQVFRRPILRLFRPDIVSCYDCLHGGGTVWVGSWNRWTAGAA